MDALSKLREGGFRGARRLNLRCGLETFPPEIYELADTLEILDLSGNRLSGLPDDLHRLGKLRILFCSDNAFEHLPEALGKCDSLEMVGFKANRIATVSAKSLPARLRWLILTDNAIATLPREIGNCDRLQKLMLAGNRLESLPDSLAACHRLELLRISANRLAALPEWLFDLPRLSWLAYAGNPFCSEVREAAPVVPWNRLSIGEKLGEGASGVIHLAKWGGREVAVKLFKGSVTSDGLPASEMSACLRAGSHPNLIGVLGRIDGHPERLEGLVLSRVSEDYANLAGPPSLESCTRDVYPEHAAFSLPTLLELARGIANAAAHLHGRGILHGDLYAHNILHCNSGHALLGDFGAASFIVPEHSAALERIEARAFSWLLEELTERCEDPVPEALTDVQARCRHAETPSFREIAAFLDEIRPPCASLPPRGRDAGLFPPF